MYKGLKPQADAILVRRHDNSISAGGIIIPDTADNPAYHGTVLAVGEGAYTERGVRVPMDVEVGDVVLYGKLCGRDIEHEGEELFFIRESDVWAIVG